MKTALNLTLIILLALAFCEGAAAQPASIISINAAALSQAEKALQRGDAEQALALLEQRDVSRDDRLAEVESLRCRALHQLGNALDAEAACSAAIDTRVPHWGDYNNRAAARMLLGDLDGAIDDLHRANRLRPGMAAVRRNLSRAIAMAEARQALASN